jgi:hypothetical protein
MLLFKNKENGFYGRWQADKVPEPKNQNASLRIMDVEVLADLHASYFEF